MKLKRWMSLALCAVLAVTMTACGSKDNAVYVQKVGDLMDMGGIAPGDRFAGMVVSENVTEIQKDNDRTIAELKVKEGDDVRKGQTLFSYDTDELQLTLDKQKLELEQLKATIENYGRQIADLERDRGGADSTQRLQYTIQIQTLQLDLKEAELKIKAKEDEVAKSEDILKNAVVTAPVAGRIQSINDSGMDQNGREAAYIVIQQSGAYRIKGTLSELQRGGIVEGNQLRIFSRTDENQTWSGTVKLVDYESPIQGNRNNGGGMIMMGGGSSDEMTNSSKYPFYVELKNTDGLLLGQHVYMELDTGKAEARPGISSAFFLFEEDGTAYVWAESKGKLEKRSVSIGEYDPMKDTYPILGGLTTEDYIAFPNPELCREGAPTTHEYIAPAPEEGMDMGAADVGMDMGAVDGGMDMGAVDAGMDMGGMVAAEMPEETVTAEAETTEGMETGAANETIPKSTMATGPVTEGKGPVG